MKQVGSTPPTRPNTPVDTGLKRSASFMQGLSLVDTSNIKGRVSGNPQDAQGPKPVIGITGFNFRVVK